MASTARMSARFLSGGGTKTAALAAAGADSTGAVGAFTAPAPAGAVVNGSAGGDAHPYVAIVGWPAAGTGRCLPVPKTALIVVDMVQTYDFTDGERLAANVEKMLPSLERLIEKAREADALIVYVNDSFGDWSTDREQLVAKARETEYGHLIDDVAPDEDVLFVLKARHSIFFQTPMDYILDEHGIEHLVLAGQATEQCILYSALDAHIRHRPVSVPRDAVAHIHDDLAEASLRMMEINMDATVCTVDDVSFT